MHLRYFFYLLCKAFEFYPTDLAVYCLRAANSRDVSVGLLEASVLSLRLIFPRVGADHHRTTGKNSNNYSFLHQLRYSLLTTITAFTSFSFIVHDWHID